MNEFYFPTDESIEMTNKVRRRAGVNQIGVSDYDHNGLRDFVLEERARKLYHKGNRRVDLICHGKFIEYVQARWAYAHGYLVLFPIQKNALDENGKLLQNEGYEK